MLQFCYDDATPGLFRACFETDSEPRKVLLRNDDDAAPEPLRSLIATALSISGALQTSCGAHLLGPYRAYCHDDLERKLLCVVDGLSSVRRRMLFGALEYFGGKGKNHSDLVSNIFGPIASASAYHHEPEIMADVIKRDAQAFFGSRRLPIFIGEGELGTRMKPEPGASRYVRVALNHDLVNALYPPEDLPLLRYRFEDGKRTVPLYFVPTIPPVFEYAMLPATGWQFNAHAIDVDVLLAMTRQLIVSANMEEASAIGPAIRARALAYDRHGWKGTLLDIPAEAGSDSHQPRSAMTLSVGVCTTSPAGPGLTKVRVTELPIGMTGDTYIDYLIRIGTERTWVDGQQKRATKYVEHPFIHDFRGSESILNKSSVEPLTENEIDVSFVARTDALEKLKNARYRGVNLGRHGLAHGIGLSEPMGRQLNYIGYKPDGAPHVLELKSYYDVVAAWLPERAALYRARVERELVMCVFKRALLIETEHAFTVDVPTLIKRLGVPEQDALFASKGFFKLNRALIEQPKYLSTAALPFHISGYMVLQSFEDAFAARTPSGGTSHNEDDETGDADADPAMTPPSYNYIRNLRLGQSSESAKRQQKIAELEARIAVLRGADYWRQLWTTELDALTKVAARRKNFWRG